MHQQNVQIVEMNLLVQIMGSSRKTFPHIFDMRRVDVAIYQMKNAIRNVEKWVLRLYYLHSNLHRWGKCGENFVFMEK